MKGSILIVDDDQGICELFDAALEQQGYEVTTSNSVAEALPLVSRKDFDVVLTDLQMPDVEGTTLCRTIANQQPDVPVIVMTAFGSVETAVAAIQAGAYDFVTKPVDMKVLALTLDRALGHRQLQRRVRMLHDTLSETSYYEGLIGASPIMQGLFKDIERVASSEASVLITGETGTGKELIASALHQRSRRAAGPFVPLNCASVPETLLDGELFGHCKGAFTDAREERKGLFLQAEKGTLYLDEIGELPMPLQPKLLRAMEARTIRPLGSEREVPVDIRVIAATNRNLEENLQQGTFRSDLYFRINVVHLHAPPLRARGNDCLLLAQAFLERFAARDNKPVTRLSRAVGERLLHYPWPGNVRELRNAIERAVTFARYEELGLEDLPESIRNYNEKELILDCRDHSELLPLCEVEKRYIAHVLRRTNDNRSETARILGLDRKTLYRKLDRYAKSQ